MINPKYPAKWYLKNLYLYIKDSSEFYENKKIFFILSTGRSGTKFLSELLLKSQNAFVQHEPNTKEDIIALMKSFNSTKESERYIKYRKKIIAYKNKEINENIYGEINPYLQVHGKSLQKYIPNAGIYYLVRNGRKIVESLMNRTLYTNKNLASKFYIPDKNDVLYANWKNISRFEKVCWYWNRIQNQLRNEGHKCLIFEKIISDFDYLNNNLLQPENIQLTKRLWVELKNKPINITIYNNTNRFYWKRKHSEIFWNICKEEMLNHGYSKNDVFK